MKNFDYFEPKEAAAAIALLAEYKESRVLAGGTDLIPQMKRGLVAPRALINLSKVSDLQMMEEKIDGMRIGAMVSLATLERSSLLGFHYPALQRAVRHIAARPIRNAATLGGNICLDTKCIYRDQVQTWRRALEPCFKLGGERCYVVRGGKACHASLAADTVPILIALQAQARIVSFRGEKSIPIEALYTGDGAHPLVLTHEELLSDVLLPSLPDGVGSSYLRFSSRKAIDFPLVSAGIYLRMKDGLCLDARVVIGAVAPGPLRLTPLEEALKGARISENLLQGCSRKAPEEAARISRSGRIDAFARRMVSRLVDQGLKEAWREGLRNE
jgi:4-hydroxybenzoyl-CoA reductase subunit beta